MNVPVRFAVRIALLGLVPAALTLSGCVTLGTHEELVHAHKETQTRLAQAQLASAAQARQLDDERARGMSLSDALKAEQARAAALDADRAGLDARLKQAQAQLASTQGELASTQGELAQVVKDKSALKGSVAEMKQALDEVARRRAEADRRIAEYKGMLQRFQVEGHTDNVPIKTEAFPSNWELASARALTVLKAMVDAGLAADRVSAASYGAEKPAAANDTAEGRAQNRRIEIVVMPDLSSLPGFEELKRAAG